MKISSPKNTYFYYHNQSYATSRIRRDSTHGVPSTVLEAAAQGVATVADIPHPSPCIRLSYITKTVLLFLVYILASYRDKAKRGSNT